MRRALWPIWLCLVLCASWPSGCGCNDDDPFWEGGDADGGGPDGLGDAVPDADANVDVPHPDLTDDDICDEQDFEIHHEIVRLMLLLDQSSSMHGTPWDGATAALTALLVNPAFYDMHFGLDAFPDGFPGFWSTCMDATYLNPFPCLNCVGDDCGTLAAPQVPIAPQYESATAIIAHMTDAFYPPPCTNTPLVDQMAYYATGPAAAGAPQLFLEEGSNYLVVISDGEDTCYDGSAASALSTLTTQILTDHGIKSFAIGFGSTSGDMAAQLNAIASSGGTSFSTFLHADDGAELEAALAEIASDVLTCRYVIDDLAPSADPELVNFYEAGVTDPIPYDEGCTETTGSGWHWFDTDHTTVEFCGDYCARIKDGTLTEISATFGCETFII
jgi:hypothetical protein